MARVVVVGAGCAGLSAAMAAREAGADVVVISKTAAQSASCSVCSAGIFSLACGGVTEEEQQNKLLTTGRGLNDQSLLHTLTKEGLNAMQKLASWGVTVKFREGTASVRKSARNPLLGGSGMVDELIVAAKSVGVVFLEWTVVREIFVKKDKACGVSVTNWRTGKHEAIAADAVILATGGAGRIYSNTDNPERVTGDGYSLAVQAGLQLRDMEFVQFYPIGWAQRGFPMWMCDATLGDFVPITDANGQEFIHAAYERWGIKNGVECNYVARDKLAILMAEKDKTGGAFAHIEEVPDTLWHDRAFLYAVSLPRPFFKDIKTPLRVAPLEHYFCGGVEIGTNGETKVDGLYACGEVTGGIDGANRMGGNALTHSVTFGILAGRAAALHPSERSVDAAPKDYIENVSADGRPVSEVRRELQSKAWRSIGPIRRKEEMLGFLNYLHIVEKENFRAETPFDCLLAMEMRGLILSAEAVAEAALQRKESVGSHHIVE